MVTLSAVRSLILFLVVVFFSIMIIVFFFEWASTSITVITYSIFKWILYWAWMGWWLFVWIVYVFTIQMQCTFNSDGLSLFYFLLVKDFVIYIQTYNAHEHTVVMLYFYTVAFNGLKYATIVLLLMIIPSGSTYGYYKWCIGWLFVAHTFVCGMKGTRSGGHKQSNIWNLALNGKWKIVRRTERVFCDSFSRPGKQYLPIFNSLPAGSIRKMKIY